MPATVTVYVPGVVPVATVNVAPASILPVPRVIVHVTAEGIGGPGGTLESVHPTSVVKNPAPLIATTVPTGPDEGVKETRGPVTVKTAVAKSRVLPLTVKMYVPGATVGSTWKDVELITPLDNVHATELVSVAGVLEYVHRARSAVLKPLPVTVTSVPAGPEFGVSVIDGEVVVTMNVV